MDGAQITALTGLITAIGTGIGWLVLRWDKRRTAVPRKAAATAHASQAMTTALTAVQDSLSADLTRVRREADEDRAQHRADRDADRARMDELDDEVQSLRREIRSVRSMWSSWYRDLTDRWGHHRQQDAPPRPPAIDEH